MSGLSGLSGLSALISGVLTPAERFIEAAGIADGAQKVAINQLVSDLQSTGLWEKHQIIYPFVGGTAASHSVNLIDPESFQLLWGGADQHNTLGIRSTTGSAGSTPYAFTSQFAPNSFCHTVYLSGPGMTMRPGEGPEISIMSSEAYMQSYWRHPDNYTYLASGSFSSYVAWYTQGSLKGFCGHYSINSTQSRARYKNINASNSASINYPIPPTQPASLSVGSNSIAPISWIAIGGQMTEQNMLDLYTVVEAYQSALGRQAV